MPPLDKLGQSQTRRYIERSPGLRAACCRFLEASLLAAPAAAQPPLFFIRRSRADGAAPQAAGLPKPKAAAGCCSQRGRMKAVITSHVLIDRLLRVDAAKSELEHNE